MNYHGKHCNKRKRLPILPVCMIMLLVCVVALSAFISAKYVTANRNDAVAGALSFYFESDLLTEDGAEYTLAPGTSTIIFKLKNYPDNLRTSDVNINYTVTLTGTTSNSKSGSLSGGKSSYAEIEFTNLSSGTYTVTATATSPYSKTLTATFIIPASDSLIGYSVSDAAQSPVVQLTVWTGDYSGNVRIAWPSGVYPDNTDPLLASAAGSSITVHFDNDSEYTFLFFKGDHSTVYTDSNFVVTAG